MSNPSQLFLLADHIKLSLLERQRATTLKIEPNPSQESNIARSLESFREGIEALSTRSTDTEAIEELRSQFNDLSNQFHGDSSSTTADTLTSPNNASLKPDFEQAQTKSSTQSYRDDDPLANTSAQPNTTKNVRFRDNPSRDSLDAEDEANRAALFEERYRDEEGTEPPDPQESMDNQQIHQYHRQIIQEQDDQLDRLGESISRQRYLSMQIGDELDGQIALLDEVDSGVDRQQSRLDSAKRRLTKVGEKAKANWGMTTIIVLIVVLVLLIVILK